MRILAVDTTGAHGSVALLENSELAGIVGIEERSPRHAETLLPTIDYLLRCLDLELEGIDGFAVAVGPGSFTGLRIGIAAVEGLAFASGKPVAGVSALDATAYRFRYLSRFLVAMIEAYRGEVYGAGYRPEGGALAMVVEPSCSAPADFLDGLPEPPALVAGTGTVRHRALIDSRFPGAFVPDASFFLAEEVARIGGAKLARGEAAPLGALEALYIRPPDAERKAPGPEAR